MKEMHFVDLCAGLGGFHRGAYLAQEAGRGKIRFTCVLAAEADEELREIYVRNFGRTLEPVYRELYPPERCSDHPALADLWDDDGRLARIHGRIELLLEAWRGPNHRSEIVVPAHDLLMAGFPCQPFSKSGAQRGFRDAEDGRGTVFDLIVQIIEERRPRFVLLENVGNFERHDGGHTWHVVRQRLERNYYVVATTHVGGEGGEGLLSPHLFGLPHHRERFFICAQRKDVGKLDPHPFPLTHRSIRESQLREK